MLGRRVVEICVHSLHDFHKVVFSRQQVCDSQKLYVQSLPNFREPDDAAFKHWLGLLERKCQIKVINQGLRC